MEAQENSENVWWKERRTNYNYLLVAAGVLGFLAFTAIWETFHADDSGTGKGMNLLLTITLLMGRHMLIFIPYIGALMYSYRFVPSLAKKINPNDKPETRSIIYTAVVLLAIILAFLPAAILVWSN